MNEWTRLHWAERRQVKEDWAWEVFAVGSKLPKKCKHVDVSAVLVFPQARRRDAENFGAVLWKMTNDALVELGVIPDDTPEYISTSNPILQVDSSGPRTELTLEVSV